MAGRRAVPAGPTAFVQPAKVADTQVQRALDALTTATQQLQANRAAAAVSVTGSRAGGTALANLLTALAGLGIITDDTTA